MNVMIYGYFMLKLSWYVIEINIDFMLQYSKISVKISALLSVFNKSNAVY